MERHGVSSRSDSPRRDPLRGDSPREIRPTRRQQGKKPPTSSWSWKKIGLLALGTLALFSGQAAAAAVAPPRPKGPLSGAPPEGFPPPVIPDEPLLSFLASALSHADKTHVKVTRMRDEHLPSASAASAHETGKQADKRTEATLREQLEHLMESETENQKAESLFASLWKKNPEAARALAFKSLTRSTPVATSIALAYYHLAVSDDDRLGGLRVASEALINAALTYETQTAKNLVNFYLSQLPHGFKKELFFHECLLHNTSTAIEAAKKLLEKDQDFNTWKSSVTTVPEARLAYARFLVSYDSFSPESVEAIYRSFDIKKEIVQAALDYSTPNARKVVTNFLKEFPEEKVWVGQVAIASPSSLAKEVAIGIYKEVLEPDKVRFREAALKSNTDQAADIITDYAQAASPEERRNIAIAGLSSKNRAAQQIAKDYQNEAVQRFVETFEKSFKEALALALDPEYAPFLPPSEVYGHILKINPIQAFHYFFVHTPFRTDGKIDWELFGAKVVMVGAAAFLTAKGISKGAEAIYQRSHYSKLPWKQAWRYGKLIDACLKGVSDETMRKRLYEEIQSIPIDQLDAVLTQAVKWIKKVPASGGTTALEFLRIYKDCPPSKQQAMSSQLERIDSKLTETSQISIDRVANVLVLLPTVDREKALVLMEQQIHRIPFSRALCAVSALQLANGVPAAQIPDLFECLLKFESQDPGQGSEETLSIYETAHLIPAHLRLALLSEVVDIHAQFPDIPITRHLLTLLKEMPTKAQRERLIKVFAKWSRENREDILLAISMLEEVPHEDQRVALAESLLTCPKVNFISALQALPPENRLASVDALKRFAQSVNGFSLRAFLEIKREERAEALALYHSIPDEGAEAIFWIWKELQALSVEKKNEALGYFLLALNSPSLEQALSFTPPAHRLSYLTYLEKDVAKIAPEPFYVFFRNHSVKKDFINYWDTELKKRHPQASFIDREWANDLNELLEELTFFKDYPPAETRQLASLRENARLRLSDFSEERGRKNSYQLHTHLKNTTDVEPLEGAIMTPFPAILNHQGIEVELSCSLFRRQGQITKVTFKDLPKSYEQQNFKKHFEAFNVRGSQRSPAQQAALLKEIQKVCRKATTDKELQENLRGVDRAAKAEMTPEALQQVLSSSVILNLLHLQGKPNEPIDNTKFYLHAILQRLDDLSDESESPTQLSPREKMLFSLAYEFRVCSTGQLDAIQQYYKILPPEYRQIDSRRREGPVEESVAQAVDLQGTLMGILSSPRFLSALTGQDRVPQESHQTQYLVNRLHKQLGLHHQITFDPHVQVISQRLQSLSNKELLTDVCSHFPVKETIVRVQKNIQADLASNKINYMKLQDFFEPLIPAEEREGWHPRYFVFNEEGLPLGITELGALTLLRALGYFYDFKIVKLISKNKK